MLLVLASLRFFSVAVQEKAIEDFLFTVCCPEQGASVFLCLGYIFVESENADENWASDQFHKEKAWFDFGWEHAQVQSELKLVACIVCVYSELQISFLQDSEKQGSPLENNAREL